MNDSNQNAQTESEAPAGAEGRPAASELDRSGWFPCPYCGERQSSGAVECGACGGLFEPLSRQATQNQMGPWFVRDEAAPFVPGRSYSTIQRMAQRGKIAPETILRGPGTRQFWMAASETPGVAHLLGRCHSCKAPASAEDFSCSSCGAAFSVSEDRQTLGLAPVRLLPGQAAPSLVARSAGPAETPAPTAFAQLAGAGASASAPRPATPAPMTPATGAVAAVRPARAAPAAPAPPVPTPATAGPAGEDPSEAPALRRSLRTASRRVTALRNLVILLAAVNIVIVVALLTIVLAGGDAPIAPADPPEAAEAASESSG